MLSRGSWAFNEAKKCFSFGNKFWNFWRVHMALCWFILEIFPDWFWKPSLFQTFFTVLLKLQPLKFSNQLSSIFFFEWAIFKNTILSVVMLIRWLQSFDCFWKRISRKMQRYYWLTNFETASPDIFQWNLNLPQKCTRFFSYTFRVFHIYEIWKENLPLKRNVIFTRCSTIALGLNDVHSIFFTKL